VLVVRNRTSRRWAYTYTSDKWWQKMRYIIQSRNSAVPHVFQDDAIARQWINGFALPLSSTPA